MNLYMKVTIDEYEFPIVIADTLQELAEKCGTTKNSIKSSISHEKAGRKRSSYKKVEIEDFEE